VLPVVALASAVAHSLISVALLAANLWLTGRLATLVFLPPPTCRCSCSRWRWAGFSPRSGCICEISVRPSPSPQVLFFLSPIFYPVAAVPERFRVVVHLNPLTSVLDAFRPPSCGSIPAWGPWLTLTLTTGTFAVLGYAWFMQTRKGFADVM
jgi:lipopolysaccharide transport system permease protein